MPAEVTCEHCGAAVAVPRGETAAGVTCTYCAQWIMLRPRLGVERAPLAPSPRRSGVGLVVFVVGAAGIVAALLFLRRAPSPRPSVPVEKIPVAVTVATVEPPTVPSVVAPSYLRTLETFGAHGQLAGQLLDARALALDGAGSVWVADYASPRVQKLDAHGRFLLQANRDTAAAPFVLGLAADVKGDVYVASDEPGAPIVVYSGEDGRVVRKLSPPSPGARTTRLAFDQAGALYAVTEDAGAQFSVTKMDATGKVLARFEKTAKNDLVAGKPAIDGEGHVYVPHELERKIYVHGASGAIVNRWGTSGHGDGDLDLGLEGLAWDGHGHVLAANGGVQVFDADGRFLLRASRGQTVWDLAVAPDGTLYVLTSDDTVHHYALDATALPK